MSSKSRAKYCACPTTQASGNYFCDLHVSAGGGAEEVVYGIRWTVSQLRASVNFNPWGKYYVSRMAMAVKEELSDEEGGTDLEAALEELHVFQMQYVEKANWAEHLRQKATTFTNTLDLIQKNFEAHDIGDIGRASRSAFARNKVLETAMRSVMELQEQTIKAEWRVLHLLGRKQNPHPSYQKLLSLFEELCLHFGEIESAMAQGDEFMLNESEALLQWVERRLALTKIHQSTRNKDTLLREEEEFSTGARHNRGEFMEVYNSVEEVRHDLFINFLEIRKLHQQLLIERLAAWACRLKTFKAGPAGEVYTEMLKRIDAVVKAPSEVCEVHAGFVNVIDSPCKVCNFFDHHGAAVNKEEDKGCPTTRFLALLEPLECISRADKWDDFICHHDGHTILWVMSKRPHTRTKYL